MNIFWQKGMKGSNQFRLTCFQKALLGLGQRLLKLELFACLLDSFFLDSFFLPFFSKEQHFMSNVK